MLKRKSRKSLGIDHYNTLLPEGVSLFRRGDTGPIYFNIQADADGKRVRRSTGELEPEAAFNFVRDQLAKQSEIPLKQACIDFFKIKFEGDTPLSPATRHGYLNSLRVTTPYFGHLTLNEIEVDMVHAFVRERQKQVTTNSVRRDLAFLSSVFSWSQREYCDVPSLNPFRAYDKRDLKEKKKQRFLTLDEFETLQRNCAQTWQELLLFTAVSTGLRHEELAALRVRDVDFHKDLINVREETAKGRKARTVPILRDLWGPLKNHCDQSECEYVFSYYNHAEGAWVRFQSFKNFFNGVRTRAKMEDVRFHDLRHTFASWWLQDGGDLKTLSVILGHESVKTTERYAFLTTDVTRRAAKERRWSQFRPSRRV